METWMVKRMVHGTMGFMQLKYYKTFEWRLLKTIDSKTNSILKCEALKWFHKTGN
jgi:hypothetical protein